MVDVAGHVRLYLDGVLIQELTTRVPILAKVSERSTFDVQFGGWSSVSGMEFKGKVNKGSLNLFLKTSFEA